MFNLAIFKQICVCTVIFLYLLIPKQKISITSKTNEYVFMKMVMWYSNRQSESTREEGSWHFLIQIFNSPQSCGQEVSRPHYVMHTQQIRQTNKFKCSLQDFLIKAKTINRCCSDSPQSESVSWRIPFFSQRGSHRLFDVVGSLKIPQ